MAGITRKLSLLAIFIFISSMSYASHFRYGVVTATRLSETGTTVTYRLNLSEAWRLGTAPTSSPFTISGGNTGSITIPMTNVTDPSGGWTNSSGSANITLNKTSTPTKIEYSSCCKISTIMNNRDGNWDVYTIINTGGPGSSPVSTLPAIINMPIGAPAATYMIPASDPDPGSTLTFGVPSFTGPLAGQSNPAGFSINPSTGQITFNTVGKTTGQQYNAMVTVTDNNGNQIELDFLINMVGASNPPIFDYGVTPANGAVYNVIAGQNISFNVKATDTDAGSTVSLSVSGLPAYITTANFSLNPLPATGNPAVTTFSWTPGAAQIGTTNVLNIIATDNVGVQTTTSVTLKVVAEPAPVFIAPTPLESSVRQIVTGIPFTDTIRASSSLNSNVSIAFVTGTPAGATYSPAIPTAGANPGETTLNWTPTPSNFGTHTFSFQATIAAFPTIFSTRNYQIIVNSLPEFSSIPVTSVIVDQFYSYDVTVSDLDIPYGDIIDIIGADIPSWLTLVSTGNGTATLSGTPSVSDVGSNPVELEAEDIHHHGNPTHIDQHFTINVIEPAPVAICKNITVQLDHTGAVSIVASDIDNGSYSLVGISSMTISQSNFTCSHVGANSVDLIVFNSYGSSDTCQATVTVADTLAPAIICGGDISINADRNDCSPIVTWNEPTATDNCTFSVSSNFNSGDRFPVGTTTVTYTVTDASGNSASCSFNVTVTPDPLVVESLIAKTYASGHNISCFGENDGEATVTVVGGCLPYSYLWSDVVGQTTATATGLAAGTYTVTITDANGTITSATVTLTQPSVLVADAGLPQTVYYGYAPAACANLTGTSNGGVPAYNYSWSNGATTSGTNVCPNVTTNYILTVTDVNGCVATDEVTICAIDVRCEYGGEVLMIGQGSKVVICHKYDQKNQNTLCVDATSVAEHLAHGDRLGACGITRTCTQQTENKAAVEGEVEELEHTETNNTIRVYPNPSSGSFNILVNTDETDAINITINTINGQVVFQTTQQNQNKLAQIPVELTGCSNGMYFLIVQIGDVVMTEKIVINK